MRAMIGQPSKHTRMTARKPPAGAVFQYALPDVLPAKTDLGLTWVQRLVKLQRLRPGYAQPGDVEEEWRDLARRILEQGLADVIATPSDSWGLDVEEVACLAPDALKGWFIGDWSAALCELAGLDAASYSVAGLGLLARRWSDGLERTDPAGRTEGHRAELACAECAPALSAV